MDSFTPKYVIIQNYILERIEAGVLKPGDRIPSEYELSKMFGVSRVTVNSAISQMRMRGVVDRIKGKGTFVKKPDSNPFSDVGDSKLHSFKISSKGHTDNHRLISLEIISVKSSNPTKLMLLPGEKYHRITRLMYAQEEIIALEYSYLPYSLYPREVDENAIEQHYLHSFISEYCKKEPRRLKTHIHITYPDVLQQKYLKASFEEPLLLWYTAVIDADGMVLGYTETCARPEDYQPYLNFLL